MSYNFLSRFSMMLNDDALKKLKNSRIIVFGLGGVGGAVVHMLVRSGVENIAVVDFDTIDVTNINRQLVAYQNNIGKLKVDELEKQLANVNPNVKVEKFPIKYSQETKTKIDIGNFDYVVDCIDDIEAKKLLIKESKTQKVPILCAMGAGNRYNEIPNFEIADISKTSYDPIAKILRKFCSNERINKLNVCYTKQKALKFDCKTIGSVVYYPISMACVMCAKIVNDIIKGA